MPYVQSKIRHMRRKGLIGERGVGYGINGGACPDWLRAEQEQRAKLELKKDLEIVFGPGVDRVLRRRFIANASFFEK